MYRSLRVKTIHANIVQVFTKIVKLILNPFCCSFVLLARKNWELFEGFFLRDRDTASAPECRYGYGGKR
jgi:hypothetical protein